MLPIQHKIEMSHILGSAQESCYFDDNIQHFVKLNLFERILRAVLSVFGIMNSSEIRCRDLSGRAVFREVNLNEAAHKSMIEQEFLQLFSAENNLNIFIPKFNQLYQCEKVLKIGEELTNKIESKFVFPDSNINGNYQMGSFWSSPECGINEAYKKAYNASLIFSDTVFDPKSCIDDILFFTDDQNLTNKEIDCMINGVSHRITVPLADDSFTYQVIHYLREQGQIDNTTPCYLAFGRIALNPLDKWKDVFKQTRGSVPRIWVFFDAVDISRTRPKA